MAILASDPGRLAPLAGDAWAVHDPHPLRLAQGFLDGPLLLFQPGLVLPRGGADKVLPRPPVLLSQPASQRLGIPFLAVHQAALKILAPPFALLAALKARGEALPTGLAGPPAPP